MYLFSFALYYSGRNYSTHKVAVKNITKHEFITFIREQACRFYPEIKQGDITTYLNTYTIQSDKYSIRVIVEDIDDII